MKFDIAEVVAEDRVVPHAGTWIEMRSWRSPVGCKKSCLTQARGLKCSVLLHSLPPHESCLTQARGLKSSGSPRSGRPCVVPHAGTWIEMATEHARREAGLSCLTQARGLKYRVLHRRNRQGGSCLTQARGLKSVAIEQPLPLDVVPHAGTWIEILSPSGPASSGGRASRRHVD